MSWMSGWLWGDNIWYLIPGRQLEWGQYLVWVGRRPIHRRWGGAGRLRLELKRRRKPFFIKFSSSVCKKVRGGDGRIHPQGLGWHTGREHLWRVYRQHRAVGLKEFGLLASPTICHQLSLNKVSHLISSATLVFGFFLSRICTFPTCVA